MVIVAVVIVVAVASAVDDANRMAEDFVVVAADAVAFSVFVDRS